ncbi:fluoride efflux transporter CrcB [Oculatella sp. LEGE 06141]|nr:fluoride efflux transporter CrcB [Oculatella sp. LEGE 06141]MBE9180708.1 fluoride efflux transporter CrcB [Oculatella sp. LEGE 06141]
MWKYPGVRTIAGISLGAIAGSLCRYYLGTWFAHLWGHAFPYGTMVINITGCFVMGFVVTASLMRVVTVHPDLHLMVTTGFLGSYTTFSSYELEAAQLANQSLKLDWMYWGGTAFLGLISLQLGTALAQRLRVQESHDESQSK